MPKYRSTVVAIAVHRANDNPIYGDGVTTVQLEDEGSGPFLSLSQDFNDGKQTIRLDFDELLIVMKAATKLFARGSDA